MAFTDPSTSLTVPTGAGPGQARYVVGSDIPAELTSYYTAPFSIVACQLFYSSITNAYYYEGILDNSTFVVRGWTANGVVNEISRSQWTGANHTTETYGNDPARQTDVVFDGTGTVTVATGGLTIAGGTAFIVTDAVTASNGAGGAATWQNLTLQASGWGGRLAIVKAPSPAHSVWLLGNLTCGGTAVKTDGTTVATLPAGFRPLTSQDIYATGYGGTISTTQNPHFNILPSGAIQVYGIGSSTGCNLNGLLSLDF